MNATAQPLVSIVTPLYNNAEHLSQCIESIRSQTYTNWECTIVNNCSTDGSRELAQRYASSDSRIRLHDNAEFLSPVQNHNAALRLIAPSSKYCKVVFADDWTFPECLDRMVSVAEAHPSIGIVSAYTLEGTRITCTGLPFPSTFLSGHEVCRRHLLDDVFVFGSANSVLYRADLVRSRQPFYNEANIHADTEVCFALLKTSDFGFVHQVLTFTRVREASLSSWSSELQTSWPGWLPILLAHGSHFLTERELKDRLDQHLSEYYRFLGKSVLRGRSKEFWKYHTSKLVESGIGFSRMRLMRGLFETVGILALNPLDAVRRIRARSRPGATDGTR